MITIRMRARDWPFQWTTPFSPKYYLYYKSVKSLDTPPGSYLTNSEGCKLNTQLWPMANQNEINPKYRLQQNSHNASHL